MVAFVEPPTSTMSRLQGLTKTRLDTAKFINLTQKAPLLIAPEVSSTSGVVINET
jgi:hypothetical protein